MSKPILSTITGINGLVKGQPWSYQPALKSGGPIASSGGWAAEGIPDGMTLNANTGLITGAPAVPGLYLIRLKAKDAANVWSDPLIFSMGVETVPNESAGAVRINVDVQTGAVWSPDNPGNAPLFVKANDIKLVSIGFVDAGTLIEIPLLGLISLGLKVWDEEPLIPLNDGLFTKVGDYDSTRYLVCLDLTTSANKPLGRAFEEFENRKGTGFLGLCEIKRLGYMERPGYDDPQPFVIASRNFPVSTFRDLDPSLHAPSSTF